MSMFRSEEMALYQLFIPPEAAFTFVSRIGEQGIAQFKDLNVDINSFQRKYVGEVRRCEEMERRLRHILSEINKEGLSVPEGDSNPRVPNAREVTQLEAQLERTESEITELSTNAVNLKSNYLEVLELKHVLEKTQLFFEEQESDVAARALMTEDSAASRGRLGFVAGMMQRERVAAFERMLWRISRGNVFLRLAQIEQPFIDPTTGNEIYKTVFVAFFQGEQLKSRVQKVCNGFHATMYQCPTSVPERQQVMGEVNTRLQDLTLVLSQTEDHRQKVLVAVAREINSWMVSVIKLKAVYHVLNCFSMDVTKKCLIGECWVPVSDVGHLGQALDHASKDVGSSTNSVLHPIRTSQEHPTYNRLNKVTQGFQNLIDAYGVACYGEVNPALYTIITFPFLFAVMFGDMGHGLILALFGAWMVITEKKHLAQKNKDEIWRMFFGGRYIILLMGLFSIYTGAIYNDLFSKSVNVFRSAWTVNYTSEVVDNNPYLILDPKSDYSDIPYPFGMDPVWQLADNKINFQNTFKMKLSIIIGVIHMLFGVTLSVANHVHFGNPVYILLEFLPQFLFLLLLFFYLVALIFVKFVLYSAHSPDVRRSPRCAPSILITFIGMMMFRPAEKPIEPVCETSYIYEGQEVLQMVLMLVALACIPVILLGKPLYLVLCKRKTHKQESKVNSMEMQVNGSAGGHKEVEGEEEEEPASEIFIHQMIHTIEYVLSTISHTASYLRLWALSLAHGQLSDVLWNMVLKMGLQQDKQGVGAIVLFFIFGAWAILSLSILVMMEGLSAFLHTLRLHWVEFMSKFYTGTGYPFQPFSFKQILAESEES